MVPFAKEKSILATAVALVGSTLAMPRTAEGACSAQDNCYAYARTDGLIIDGVAARYDVTNVGVADIDDFGFVNHALWANVNSAPTGYFVEVGWMKWKGGGVGYHHYYAYGYLDSAGTPEIDWFNIPGFPVGPIGTSHHYQLVRVYDGLYRACIDNQEAWNYLADPYTLRATTGLEYTHPDSDAEVNQPREFQWRHAGNLTWHSWGQAGTVGAYEIGPRSEWDWIPWPTHGRDWIE